MNKMTEMTKDLPDTITDEANGMTYTLNGDYYLPDIGITEEERQPIGMWGMRRMAYLKKQRPGYYSELLLDGRLMAHLRMVNEQAKDRLETLMNGYKRCRGITEELKSVDQMKWVRMMNLARAEAEHNVLEEIIYE